MITRKQIRVHRLTHGFFCWYRDCLLSCKGIGNGGIKLVWGEGQEGRVKWSRYIGGVSFCAWEECVCMVILVVT